MSIFETKIKNSIGYVNTIKALDNVFGKDYTIQEFIPSDDETKEGKNGSLPES
jgi:hypothetical protein